MIDIEKFKLNYYPETRRKADLIFPVRGRDIYELVALAEWAVEVKEELDCVNREDEISETCEECRCLNKLIKQFPKDGER